METVDLEWQYNLGMRTPFVLRNANILTMSEGRADLGMILRGAIVVDKQNVSWVGPEDELPLSEYAEEVDCERRWITPSLVDCHTHIGLVTPGVADVAFADAFASRANEIAQAARNHRYRYDSSVAIRVREGVTSISGIGLTERYSPLGGALTSVDMTIFEWDLHCEVVRGLSADDVPAPEERSSPTQVKKWKDQYLGGIHSHCAFDVAGDEIDVSLDNARTTAEFLRPDGFPMQIHADVFRDFGGAELAARFGMRNASHLNHSSVAGIEALAWAGTTGVILPGPAYFDSSVRRPPIDEMRRCGVPIAIGTDDHLDGRSLGSLRLAASFAHEHWSLTVEECLLGITRNAARSMRPMTTYDGIIGLGKPANLAIWNVEHPAEIVTGVGRDLLWMSMYCGTETLLENAAYIPEDSPGQYDFIDYRSIGRIEEYERYRLRTTEHSSPPKSPDILK